MKLIIIANFHLLVQKHLAIGPSAYEYPKYKWNIIIATKTMYDDYIQTNGWCVKVIITMLSWVQHHYELYFHKSKCEAYLS